MGSDLSCSLEVGWNFWVSFPPFLSHPWVIVHQCVNWECDRQTGHGVFVELYLSLSPTWTGRQVP